MLLTPPTSLVTGNRNLQNVNRIRNSLEPGYPVDVFKTGHETLDYTMNLYSAI